MSPDQTPSPEPPPTIRDRQSALIDADRLTMQVVQTALSLIGFGFTINAFFNDVSGAALAARRLGLGMLTLGLLFLLIGVWNQVRYRRALARRFQHLPRTGDAMPFSASASITAAVLLLFLGLFGFVSIMLRAAY
jgi:uncharacterized membrane protein YidH (DUF202 family)